MNITVRVANRLRSFVPWLRWLLPALTAAALFAVDLWADRLVTQRVPEKGSIAQYTIRAESDAAFDLHETQAEELEEARQSDIPIYEKDNTLLYLVKERIVDAALARPINQWSWPSELAAELETDAGRGGGDVGHSAAVAADAGPSADAQAPRVGSVLSGRSTVDGGVGRTRAADEDSASREQLAPDETTVARRAELAALLRGCFRLLEPFYSLGVVADTEFPREKQQVRLSSSGRYVLRPVSRLYRFSDLRPALEHGAKQFFFKSSGRIRSEVIDFILARLPANVTYSAENERFIRDISQVTGLKMVLLRRGAVIVGRGNVVNTRAYHAIRASVRAARETSRVERGVGRFVVIASLLLLFVLAADVLCPTAFAGIQAHLLVHIGVVLLGASGCLALLYWPVDAAVLPQAAVALIAAVTFGRGPALLVAGVVAIALAFALPVDLAAIVISAAGGCVAALVVSRRARAAVLSAGILVGLAQALAYEACRAASGRAQTAEELWGAAQAFGGGLLAGGIAIFLLPFVQRWVGQASRGKLKVLGDYDHPLLRRLRERRPDVFAHLVRVADLAECAARSVGADHLLTRVGALFHDIGKMEEYEIDEPGTDTASTHLLDPRAHIARGLAIAARYHLPTEVVDFIVQQQKPRSLETAIVMIANRVEHETRADAMARLPEVVVQSASYDLLAQHAFADCALTQAQLCQIQDALIGYLEKHK